MQAFAEQNQGTRDARFERRSVFRAAVKFGLVFIGLGIGYALLDALGITELLQAGGFDLQTYLEEFGALGPTAVIALMSIAVVMSPLPSAPIALAAGAAYGHAWGTLYVVIGAQIGATVAFLIARYIRPPRLADWLGELFTVRDYDSQNTLTFAVFASRLMPFISFDLASYAAGMTPLRAWRFTIATLLGILPASFLLTHIGGEVATLNGPRVATALGILVAAGAVPIVVRSFRSRRKARQ